jgi:hypothetical protein
LSLVEIASASTSKSALTVLRTADQRDTALTGGDTCGAIRRVDPALHRP